VSFNPDVVFDVGVPSHHSLPHSFAPLSSPKIPISDKKGYVHMDRLRGRVALITGGGSGIGRATAERFAAEGAAVMVTGRREEALAGVVAAVKDAGGKAAYCQGDVSIEADVRRMVDSAVSTFGGLDIVVNNASVLRRGEDLRETTEAEWDRDLDVNLKGVFFVIKHALPHLESGHGCIVNVASQLAFVAAPGYATYCASKGGVVSFTRAVAMDVAGKGVRANCVCPGLVDTKMARLERPDFEERRDEYDQLHPLGRIGQPDDIANAILFLASDEASWITGQALIVDGGFSSR